MEEILLWKRVKDSLGSISVSKLFYQATFNESSPLKKNFDLNTIYYCIILMFNNRTYKKILYKLQFQKFCYYSLLICMLI